ncbi:MAG: hypothetical protein RBU29_15600 [bacterium]|jgi:hypothetical protein|nr:hypothetical protein [bacterium]
MANMDHEIQTVPLVFGTDTSRWQSLKPFFQKGLDYVAEARSATYSESKKVVARFFQLHELQLPHRIVKDEDAKEVLDTVYEVEAEMVRQAPIQEELYRRSARHIREYMADLLLKFHHQDLKAYLQSGQEGIKELADILGMDSNAAGGKSIIRFAKKVNLYLEVGSFVHAPELSLSTIKVKTRSKARADRGNLWTVDRREKYHYLESLADANKVCPSFTEADLEFLVSQSSLDMLKKKSSLLLDELKVVEPNRLKANYSRLKDHLHRSKQRKSDYQLRRDLLKKMGASEEQIEYISARATYQTMKNLLKLANGKIAISDLMGGKRTIRKLLRRGGKAQSEAELQICKYLHEVEGVDKSIASNYARTRKNHSLRHLKQTITFLKENYRHLYRMHWGFDVRDNILRRAMEFGLSRNKLSKRALSNKDFLADLRKASAIEETRTVREQDVLTPTARRVALTPLKEVLDYETDTDTRKQLYFIYELFCDHGFCITKDKLKEICLQNTQLFPSQRKVQDALEILNGAYRAIGQLGETLCVLPDYLDINKAKESDHPKAHTFVPKNF